MTVIDNPLILYPILIQVGFIAGFFGSMLGLGGGWLTVPALQLFGVEPLAAVGTSLTAMIFNAATGTYKYYKKKILLVSLGLVLAVPGLIGVFLGKSTLTHLSDLGYSETALKTAFIVLQITLAVVMLLSAGKKKTELDKKARARWASFGPAIRINDTMQISALHAGVIGLTAGFLSGLLGIGGGIIMTPALVALFGISVVQAASASLLSVLISALLGSSLYWFEGKIIVTYAVILAVSTAAGSFLGSSLAPRMRESVLKRIFGCLTLLTAVALIMIGSSTPSLPITILLVGSMILFMIALKAKKSDMPY